MAEADTQPLEEKLCSQEEEEDLVVEKNGVWGWLVPPTLILIWSRSRRKQSLGEEKQMSSSTKVCSKGTVRTENGSKCPGFILK